MFESYVNDLIDVWFYMVLACGAVNLMGVAALGWWMNRMLKNRKYDSTKFNKRFKF